MQGRQTKYTRGLQELVRIITNYGPTDSNSVGLKTLRRSPTAAARLFRLMEAGQIRTDKELQQSLVSASGNNRASKSHYFSVVKARLRKRLLNTLFELDFSRSDLSGYAREFFVTNKQCFIARTLMSFGARETAVSFARRGLPRATAIEEWSLAMEFLILLRRDASQRGDSRSHEFYAAEYEQCHALLKAEFLAERAMETVQLAFSKRGGEHPSYASTTSNAAQDVLKIAQQFPSFKLRTLSIRLRLAESQVTMKYQTTLTICDEGLLLLRQNPIFSNRARIAEYAIALLVSAVQLKNIEQTKKGLDLCNSSLRPSENNWFVFKQYQFLGLMRHEDFIEAEKVLEEVFSNTRFATLTESNQERWGLYRLYCRLVLDRPIHISDAEELHLIAPVLSADRSGFKMLMIILFVMLLAKRQKFSLLRDRIEVLRTYRRRHLRGEHNRQAALFFRLLSILEDSDFDYKTTVRRVSKLSVELRHAEEHDAVQGEIVLSYSYVWNYILDALKKYSVLNQSFRQTR